MSAITNDFGSPFDRRPAWSSVLNNLERRLSRGECPIGSNTSSIARFGSSLSIPEKAFHWQLVNSKNGVGASSATARKRREIGRVLEACAVPTPAETKSSPPGWRAPHDPAQFQGALLAGSRSRRGLP